MATDPRDARIPVDLEVDRILAMLVQMPQRLLELLGIDHHGAEREHAEASAAKARTLLNEDYRPRAAELDGQRDSQQQRRYKHQHQRDVQCRHPSIATRS